MHVQRAVCTNANPPSSPTFWCNIISLLAQALLLYHVFFPPLLSVLFFTHSIVEESHNMEQYCDHCDCGGTCVNKAVDFIMLQPFPGAGTYLRLWHCCFTSGISFWKNRKCSFTICVVKRAHLCDEADSESGWYCFIDARRSIREYINTITLKVIARRQKCHLMSNVCSVSVKFSPAAS